MALSDRKIPIINGVNDVPSVVGHPKHPNEALFCKKYNDLIDNELTILMLGGASSIKTVRNGDIYLDLTLPVNGDGTEANPFNNLQSFIAFLNSGIFIGEVTVICVSNVDFGHLEIKGTHIFDNLEQLLIIRPETTQIITYSSIQSTIPLVLDHSINASTLSIFDSTVYFGGNVTITSSLVVKNSILLTKPSISTLVFEVALALVVNSTFRFDNTQFTETIIDGHDSNFYFSNLSLDSGNGINTFHNGVFFQLESSDLKIIDSILENYTRLVVGTMFCNFFFHNVTYSDRDTEFSSIQTVGSGNTLIIKNCTGFDFLSASFVFASIDGAVEGNIGGGSSVDHISLTNTSGLVKTYTIWGDGAETDNLGTFSVNDGADGVPIPVVVLTQLDYDALGVYDANTFYVINS